MKSKLKLVDQIICERRHEPVRWGNDVCIETWIQPSTYLQKKWGGKDLTPGPETTPGAFYEGNRIRCKVTR